MNIADDHRRICPICHQHEFNDDYDICNVCFWENDPFQYEDINFDGLANHLSVVQYRKWWEAVNTLLPAMLEKYHITKSKLALWTYDELVVPRENIKNFVDELTKYNIGACCSFYNICERYNYDEEDFYAFPFITTKSVRRNNKESLDIIFTKNPLQVCEKYKLLQLKEILEQTEDKLKLWEELTPNISIMPNPYVMPKM